MEVTPELIGDVGMVNVVGDVADVAGDVIVTASAIGESTHTHTHTHTELITGLVIMHIIINIYALSSSLYSPNTISI